MKLDIHFDSASLDIAASRVIGDRVVLRGHDNHYPGQWKWVHFRLDDCRGRTVTFEIPDNFEPGSDHLAQHHMVYSYDGERWAFFPHNDWRRDELTFEFSLDAPFEADQVFVAYGIPYPTWRVERLIDRLRPSPFVHPAPGGDASLIIGRTSGGVDVHGRMVPSLPLYGFGIGEGERAGRRVVLMAGVHPNETPANHMMDGLLAFLVDPDDPAAKLVRQNARILVYPMVNPEGRYAGYNRGTREFPDRDANRFWHEDLYQDIHEIRTVAEAMKRDLNGPPDYFIDLHSWTDTADHFGILTHDEGFHRDPFWQAFRRIEPGVGEEPSDWKNWSTETFAFKRLGARFAMTFETMFVPHLNVDGYQNLGRNLGRALAEGLAAGVSV